MAHLLIFESVVVACEPGFVVALGVLLQEMVLVLFPVQAPQLLAEQM